MTLPPRVSIILTSFNHAKYLREAIDSALNQTFKDFELIIWDDASSDNSWNIIQSYCDPRIKAFRNEQQMRGVYGINKAISEVAAGEYIAIHHSDDVWLPEKLEKQIAFLDIHIDVGAVFTNVQAINETGALFSDKSHLYYAIFDQKNRSRHQWLRHFFEKGNALCHPSILIRKRCYDDCGLYRYGLAQFGDFDMWMRLCFKYEISVLSEKLTKFRVRDAEANTSGSRPETRSRGAFEFYLLLSNYLKLDRAEDVLKVFPEAIKYLDADYNSVRYAMAMSILEIKPFYFSVQYALQILFDFINNTDNREIPIKDIHQFVKLTGELDPLQVTRIEQLNNQVFNLNQSIAERDSQIANLTQVITEHDNRVNQSVIERDNQITNLTQAVTERDNQVANLNAIVAERDKQIENLQKQIAEDQLSFAQIRKSRSWRITRPLRGIRRMMDRCILWLRGHMVINGLRIARQQLNLHGVIGFLRRIPYYLRQLRYQPSLLRTVPAHAPEFLSRSIMKHEVRMHPELQGQANLHLVTKISVVIPTLNAGPEFPWLLQKLLRQKGIDSIEIIIVDSGSKDNTVTIAKEAGCVVVNILPAEFSHSYARNRGADEATGDYLLFMVQDAYPIGDYWMVGMLQFLQDYAHDKLVAVSCAEYSRSDSDVMYDSMIHTHYQFLGCLHYDRIGEFKEQGHISLRSQGQLSDVSCMIERSTFQRYRYRGDYAEDLDLGIRLIQDGYRVAMLASVKVIHSHNRPAYYYFKRSFVDVIFLINLFPDFEYVHIESQSGLFTGILSISIFLTHWLQTPLPSEYTSTRDSLRYFNNECRRQFASMSLDEAIHLDNAHLDNWLEQLRLWQKTSGSLQRRLDTKELQEARRFLDAFLGRVDHFGHFVEQVYVSNTDTFSIELRQAILKVYAAAAGSALAFMFLDITRQRCQGDVEQAHAIYSDLKAGI